MKGCFFFLFFYLFFGLFSSAQVITTVIGNGFGSPSSGAYAGDGAQATQAELYWPFSITLASGNIYVADTYNRRIRKINNSGIITTIAGGGNAGLGDGGPATAAGLWNPTQVLFDAPGNLYIVDASHNRIRMVNTNGIIQTIAGIGTAGFSGDGGQATAASLNGPQYAAFDAGGNLYIADVNNNRIRMLNTSGIISTVAGTGIAGYNGDGVQATAAELNGPDGVTFDTQGNLYIADYSNNRIRMIDKNGIISTIAGNGRAGYSGDGGQATAAQLNGPNDGIVFDALGNFYIPDALNNRIRKVNTLGIISTLAGNGNSGFSGDGGPAIAAELNYPGGVALDSALCNLYIADLYNNRIRVVTNAEVTISVNSPTVCIGNAATITANGAANYTWTPSTNLNTNLGSVVVSTGTASITYTVMSTLGSCHNEATSFVHIFPLPVLTVTSPTICMGDTGTLVVSGASTYTWSNGTQSASLQVSPASATSYSVLGESIQNCLSNPAFCTISVSPKPIVSVSSNQTLCIGENTELSASGATTYSWSTGEVHSSISVKPITNTTYTVTGTNGFCNERAVVTILVKDPFDFSFPPIVTPNNDGINDYIDFGLYSFSSLQVDIYNRWGAKVFESKEPASIWKPSEEDGTYYFLIQGQQSCNQTFQNKWIKGFITIIR